MPVNRLPDTGPSGLAAVQDGGGRSQISGRARLPRGGARSSQGPRRPACERDSRRPFLTRPVWDADREPVYERFAIKPASPPFACRPCAGSSCPGKNCRGSSRGGASRRPRSRAPAPPDRRGARAPGRRPRGSAGAAAGGAAAGGGAAGGSHGAAGSGASPHSVPGTSGSPRSFRSCSSFLQAERNSRSAAAS